VEEVVEGMKMRKWEMRREGQSKGRRGAQKRGRRNSLFAPSPSSSFLHETKNKNTIISHNLSLTLLLPASPQSQVWRRTSSPYPGKRASKEQG
jgi:hypothetical protein